MTKKMSKRLLILSICIVLVASLFLFLGGRKKKEAPPPAEKEAEMEKVEEVEENLVQATFLNESYKEAKKLGAPLIHWIPRDSGVPCEVTVADASVAEGLAEEACRKLKPNEIIQFERFGFVRVDGVNEKLIVYFAHR